MSSWIHHTHLKPQNYYNRLFLFFGLVALSLTLSLIRFDLTHLDVFLLKFIVIYFLLLTIAALVEFKKNGDYMSPLEIFDVEIFYKKFILELKEKNIDEKFNKYDYKSKKVLKKFQRQHSRHILSSIRKKGRVYEITFIDERKMVGFIITRFLILGPIHKIFVEKINGEYKIHRLI